MNMIISAKQLDARALNQAIRGANDAVAIHDCYGQRFIGCGTKDKTITIRGTPGNALGAYMDGGEIQVYGNAQDAVGDTMNSGRIVIHGNAGDALGYAMRGGSIYVRGNAGYRTGIHMKEYADKKPVIVVGGTVGSFLGEYLAGGLIIVLGMGTQDVPIGNFTGTGMHGGKILLRTKHLQAALPAQVSAGRAARSDLDEITPHIAAFAQAFGMDAGALLQDSFYTLRPNDTNPYEQFYVAN